MPANRSRSSFSAGRVGANRSTKFEDVEELRRRALLVGCQRRHEVDRRARAPAGLVEEDRQRRDLVAGLDLLDLVDVGRPEQLRAVEHHGQVGVRADHLVDARRASRPSSSARPAGTCRRRCRWCGCRRRRSCRCSRRRTAASSSGPAGSAGRSAPAVRCAGRRRRPSTACPSWASGWWCPPGCTPGRCCGSRSSRPCTPGPACRRSRCTGPGSCRPSGSRRCRPPWRWRGPARG